MGGGGGCGVRDFLPRRREQGDDVDVMVTLVAAIASARKHKKIITK